MIKTAISFALACVLFLHLSTLPSLFWLWLSLPACFLLKFTHTRYVGVMVIAALWTLLYSHSLLNNRISDNITGQEIIISGTVSSVPVKQLRQLQFEFKPDSSSLYVLPNKIRLNWYQPLPEHLNAGEKWQLSVKLKPARGMMNPGNFDYESWLFQQGIGATGYVRTASTNQRLKLAHPYSINVLRQSLVEHIESLLPQSRHTGLIQGLTTGIRHNIDQTQWQVLRRTGTNHLLAISGLHIGLAATIGFILFRFLWSLRANNLLLLAANEIGAIGGFLFALFYAGLAGFSIPTQRALIMVTTVMVTILIRRPIFSSHILAVSLISVLIFNPLSVLSTGFWLSFSAVAIILFISQNRYPVPQWQWAKIHILIAVGLSPLLLLFFMEMSIIAPFANIIAIPFVSFLLVPLLLLASVLIGLWPPIAKLLLNIIDHLLNLLWFFLETLSTLSFSHWQSPSIPFYYWVPIIIGVVLLISPRNFPAKSLGLIAFVPLLFFIPDKPKQGEFWFTLLDVGQGLSSVIQTQHHTLVFDTGPKFSHDFNTGTAVVKPFLHAQGIQHIDTLIISHSDNDHIGGAIPLINEIETRQILSSAPQLLPNANSCHAGHSWQWDGVNFSILNPGIDDHGSKNDLSCVLRVSHSNGSVLLTADIERKAEQRLVQRYGNNLKSTLLIAPHHGSKTSSSQGFINAVSPQITLFPIGFRNRYNFPHQRILRRYQQHGSVLYNSADHGAIQLKFHQNSTSKPQLWRTKNRNIWTSNEDAIHE